MVCVDAYPCLAGVCGAVDTLLVVLLWLAVDVKCINGAGLFGSAVADTLGILNVLKVLDCLALVGDYVNTLICACESYLAAAEVCRIACLLELSCELPVIWADTCFCECSAVVVAHIV